MGKSSSKQGAARQSLHFVCHPDRTDAIDNLPPFKIIFLKGVKYHHNQTLQNEKTDKT